VKAISINSPKDGCDSPAPGVRIPRSTCPNDNLSLSGRGPVQVYYCYYCCCCCATACYQNDVINNRNDSQDKDGDRPSARARVSSRLSLRYGYRLVLRRPAFEPRHTDSPFMQNSVTVNCRQTWRRPIHQTTHTVGQSGSHVTPLAPTTGQSLRSPHRPPPSHNSCCTFARNNLVPMFPVSTRPNRY
jgi:hypothetical protein